MPGNQLTPTFVMTARYVLLTHDHPHLHWDLMLEEESSLRTWRLAQEPLGEAPIKAEPLPAHRKHYLDYEGPVSGDRGTVTQWDAGDYLLEIDREEEIWVSLSGKRLRGRAILKRDPDTEFWTFQLTESEDSDS